MRCKFQVIGPDVPLKEDGILGLDFLQPHKASICFEDNTLKLNNNSSIPLNNHSIKLPGRSRVQVAVRVTNTEIQEGIINKLDLGHKIYAGNVLVKNRNGIAWLYVVNTNEEEKEIDLPSVQLEEIGSMGADDVNKIEKSEKDRHERINKLIKSLHFEGLNTEERNSIVRIISKYPYQFYLPGDKLIGTNVIKHKIITTDEVPINTRQYRYPQVHKEEIQRQIKEMLEGGIIESSNSPYNSPVWIVSKKPSSTGEKRWRVVIDFRNLNEKTVGDAYPLPNIVEILDQLGGAKYFSVFDLASGFHQIFMDELDKIKTAFSTPNGHYQFRRMPFGLKNSPSTFQRLMDNILSGLQGIELFVYLDDIVIYAVSLKDHERKLMKLLGRLQTARLLLQPDKCRFLQTSVNYLGHVISQDGLCPDPGKINAVKNFPVPTNARKIKEFLGLIGYYRRFIPNFASMSRPLTQLLKKGQLFCWSDERQRAFENLRDMLCREPILQFPDFTKPFIVTTDASFYALGAVLSQGEIGKDLPIAYASKLLKGAELNYSFIEKELFAIVFAVKHYRPYLFGRKFYLVTDHRPLVWAHRIKDPTSRLLHWLLKLRDYQYDVIYKPGRLNSNADALSRNPVDIKLINNVILTQSLKFNESLLKDEANKIELNEKFNDKDKILPVKENEASMLKQSGILKESDVFPSTYRPVVIDENRPPTEAVLLAQGDEWMNIKGTYPTEKPEKVLDWVDKVPAIVLPSSKWAWSSERSMQQMPERTSSPPDMSDVVKILNVHAKVLTYDSSKRSEIENDLAKNTLLTSVDGCERRASLYLTESDSESDSFNNNDSFPEPISDDDLYSSEDEINQTPEAVGQLAKRFKRSTLPDVFSETKDGVFMKKDNIAHFWSADFKSKSPVTEELINKKYINIEEFPKQLEVGEVIISKKNSFHIFTVIIKLKSENKTQLNDVLTGITNLKETMDYFNVKTVRIARTGDGLDKLPWGNIKSHLTKTFPEGYYVTLCLNQIEIPSVERRLEIIREAHESAVGGHKGIVKTYGRIRQQYYWENMKVEVQNFIKHCILCQRNKLVRVKTRQPMVITDTPQVAFEKIALDIVGPLPVTTSGNKYVLTIQDSLTKYSLAIPLAETTAENIAKVFAENFICLFGCPESILTDQGKNFTGLVMKHLAKLFKIRKIQTTAFHPQTNGSLERSHLVLVEYLRNFIDQNRDWDTWLKYAMFSYNTSIHEGTGFTPHELIFGGIAKFPSSFTRDSNVTTYVDYLGDLVLKLRETRSKAAMNLDKAKLKSKEYYDRRVNPKEFSEGDWVFLVNDAKTNKLDPNYTGPYKILEVFNNENVSIQITASRTKVVRTNKLKLAYL